MDKIVNKTDYPEQYVYHYTSSQTAINHILNSGTLLFNTFDNVNDPRENKDWQFDLYTHFSLGDSLEPSKEFSRQVSLLLKSKVKMVCFSSDSDEAIEMTADNILSRGFSKPAMWHHYANKHDGVCLMFDRKKLDAAFRRYLATDGLLCGFVEYSNSGFLTRLSGHPFLLNLSGVNSLDLYHCVEPIRKHLFKYYKDLFFRKLENWSNESEFRWLYFDSSDNTKPIKFDDALVGILVGDMVSQDVIQFIHDYSSKNKTCYLQITWRNGFPKFQSP